MSILSNNISISKSALSLINSQRVIFDKSALFNYPHVVNYIDELIHKDEFAYYEPTNVLIELELAARANVDLSFFDNETLNQFNSIYTLTSLILQQVYWSHYDIDFWKIYADLEFSRFPITLEVAVIMCFIKKQFGDDAYRSFYHAESMPITEIFEQYGQPLKLSTNFDPRIRMLVTLISEHVPQYTDASLHNRFQDLNISSTTLLMLCNDIMCHEKNGSLVAFLKWLTMSSDDVHKTLDTYENLSVFLLVDADIPDKKLAHQTAYQTESSDVKSFNVLRSFFKTRNVNFTEL